MAANINIRTDPELKKEAEALFESMGLNMTTAVNVFLRQSLRVNGLPFEVKSDVPNKSLKAAIKEADELLADKNAARYSDIESLKKSLDL